MSRNKRYHERRTLLLLKLGNRCVKCGETDPALLEFDHIHNDRTWKVRKCSCIKRIRLYEKEADEGRIQILCGHCNKAKRRGEPYQCSDEPIPW